MAEARQKAEWLRVGVAVAWVVNRNGWTKEAVQPLSVIPECYRPALPPPPELTPAEKAAQSRMAWAVLDTVFGGKGNGRSRRGGERE